MVSVRVISSNSDDEQYIQESATGRSFTEQEDTEMDHGAGRSGMAGEGTPAATACSMVVSARMMAPPCDLGCGIRAETPGADPGTEQQRFGVIRTRIQGAGPRTAPE